MSGPQGSNNMTSDQNENGSIVISLNDEFIFEYLIDTLERNNYYLASVLEQRSQMCESIRQFEQHLSIIKDCIVLSKN